MGCYITQTTQLENYGLREEFAVTKMFMKCGGVLPTNLQLAHNSFRQILMCVHEKEGQAQELGCHYNLCNLDVVAYADNTLANKLS